MGAISNLESRRQNPYHTINLICHVQYIPFSFF